MSLSFLPSLLIPLFCLILPLVLLNSFFSFLQKDNIS